MRSLFVKKVADSVVGQNKIKLDITSIGNEEYILELKISESASKEILKCLKLNADIKAVKNIKMFAEKILIEIHIKKLLKQIKKCVTKNKLEGYVVVFSNNLQKEVKEYFKKILKEFEINEYVLESTVKNNLWKYIEDFKTQNNFKDGDISPLLLLKNANMLEIDMLEAMNLKYKEIAIYAEKINSKCLKNVKNINEENGSCIEILKKTDRDFRRFNVYIFVDIPKSNYMKYRFNKKACYIDFTSKENDKYNEKYLILNQKLNQGKYYINKIKEMYELYGKITVSNLLIE